MISNYVLREQKERIRKQRDELNAKKEELVNIIHSLNITKQAAWKHNNGVSNKIDEPTLTARNKASKQLREIEQQFIELNKESRKLYIEEDSAKNKILLSIFKEIFEEKQLSEIYSECSRRMKGETPFKISFAWKELDQHKENSGKYKKALIEQLDKMISFRILLTGLIDKGCEQFGKAEFLTFISPLNRLIIPVDELEKIKRKIIK